MRMRCPSRRLPFALLFLTAAGNTPAPSPQSTSAAKSQPAAIAKISASGVLGRAVDGPDGQQIGRIVDVLVDAGSNPRAAVIDFGGFMGIGNRRVAVDWSDMTFPPTGSTADIKLDLSLDQIRSAPSYSDQTRPAAVAEPPPAKPAPPATH